MEWIGYAGNAHACGGGTLRGLGLPEPRLHQQAATIALFGMRSAAQTFLASRAGGLAGFVFTVGWGITADSGGTGANYFVGVEGGSGPPLARRTPARSTRNIGFAMKPRGHQLGTFQHSDTTTPEHPWTSGRTSP